MLKIKKYIGYGIVVLLVNLVLFPILLLHTPFFNNAKKVYVESAMGTASHRWLASKFLSNEEIKKISSKSNMDTSLDRVNTNTVHIPKVNNESIQSFKITNTRYLGYGLIINNPRRVKVASSKESGVIGEHIEEIIKKNNAISGVNAGGFLLDDEKGKIIPLGILMSGGKLIYPHSENKVSLNNLCICAIDKNGLLIVGKYTLDQLKKLDVKEAIAFGPVLVKDGKAVTIENSEIWGTGSGLSQRTLIGQRQDGAIILVVTEGILNSRISSSLNQAQQLMLDLGAINAINLDGGNSTVLYNDGQIINKSVIKQTSRNLLSSAIIVK